MPVAATTAEWNCTRCGTTNRKLVPVTDERSHRPLHHTVGARHMHRAGRRPVRWMARQD